MRNWPCATRAHLKLAVKLAAPANWHHASQSAFLGRIILKDARNTTKIFVRDSKIKGECECVSDCESKDTHHNAGSAASPPTSPVLLEGVKEQLRSTTMRTALTTQPAEVVGAGLRLRL